MLIEIRADNTVHIEGYVNAVERDSNIINVPSVGRCVEQIRAGVFDKALSSGADVSILENHDNSRRLGSISEGNLKLYEDNIGLRAIADIVDADIADKARRKMLKGWSFGFICTENEIEQRAGNVPRRIVKGMMLSEVSLIDGDYKPCYNGTLVEVRSEGNFIEYRAGIDETVEVNTPTESADTSTDAEIAPVDSTADGEDVENRAEEPDYSYYDAMLRYLELRYNPYHDPGNGRFTSGGGGGGGVLVVPKGQKGKGFYVGTSASDYAEELLAREYGTIGEAGTGIRIKSKALSGNYAITENNNIVKIDGVSSPLKINGKTVKADEFAQKAIDSGMAEFIPKYKVKQLKTAKQKERDSVPDYELGNSFQEHGWGAAHKMRNYTAYHKTIRAEEETDPDDPV